MRRAVAAAALLAAALAAQAANVAFVADVRGAATIEGNGRLTFLAELAPGTRLLLGTNAAAAITFSASGSEFTLSGPGEFTVGMTDVRADRGAPPTRKAVAALGDPGVVARVAQAATASVRMRSVNPAPAAASALPVAQYPVDARVATLRPVLRWRGDMSMDGATLRVVDASGKEVWKARTNAAPPPMKLSPGTRYAWTVMTARGTSAEASFETLPAEALARAEKSRAAARSFPEKVVHALLLQDLGATQDAREAWEALARERPDLPELAALAR